MNSVASNRFIDNRKGAITDTKTGLMWVLKDNGVPINAPAGKSTLPCPRHKGARKLAPMMPALSLHLIIIIQNYFHVDTHNFVGLL